MRRFLIAFVLVLSLMFVSNVHASFLNNGSRFIDLRSSYFIGLWQGIDPVDGSEVLFSIFKNDDGTFSILGHESSFFVCDDTDKGVITGKGQIEHGVLVTTEMRLQCLQEKNLEPIFYSVEYEPDKTNQILIYKAIGGDPPSEPIILYRISKQY